jgi:CheY-like chemotaxis protein
MDIQLPVMDGYDAAKSIRSIKQDVIIIAQTAYGMHADRQKIMDAGFNDFFIKPVVADILLEKIKQLLPEE